MSTDAASAGTPMLKPSEQSRCPSTDKAQHPAAAPTTPTQAQRMTESGTPLTSDEEQAAILHLGDPIHTNYGTGTIASIIDAGAGRVWIEAWLTDPNNKRIGYIAGCPTRLGVTLQQ